MIRRLVLPILVVVFTYIMVILFCGSLAWTHVDLPSFLVVPILPLAFVAGSHGFKGLGSAFSAPFSPSAGPRELRLAVAVFEELGKAFWSFGAMGSCLGFVEVLRNLTDRSKLGPNLAVALLTLLYAALFGLLLVQPFLAQAKRRLAEDEAA